MNKVKVIDAICGAGKSTHIMKVMKNNPEERWMYVSPYLDEVGDGSKQGRIQREIPELDFKAPAKSGGKEVNLRKIIATGANVAITHNLLLGLDVDTIRILEQEGYNVVIDETLDVISKYDGIHRDDIKCLVGHYVLKDEVTGKLSWNYDLLGDEYNGSFAQVKNMCDLDSLYIHKGIVLINKLSPKFLEAAKSVTVLTYMFEGSVMSTWLQMSGIEYEYQPLDSGRDPEQIKQSVRENLIILDTPRAFKKMNLDPHNRTLQTAFSKSWYQSNEELLPDIKRTCESTVKLIKRKYTKNTEVLWTTFKKYEKDIQGNCYTRRMEESPEGDTMTAFVPKNMKASNEHANCNVCLYLVNVYPHGDITSYVNTQGYRVDFKALAISEMVQFIFRGSIRKGEKMYLVVASDRMKSELLKWLEKPV